MATESITLSRGEKLQLEISAENDGVAVTLDDTWTVASSIKPKVGCGETLSMSPVIADGVVSIEYDTTNLLQSSYVFDVKFTESGTGDQFSQKINLYLSDTITPA